MSWYLTIRSDPSYSHSTDSGPLVEHLLAVPGLVRTGPLEFRSAPGFPWLCLVAAPADAAGSYAAGRDEPMVNVVELVCGDGDADWYESLAVRLAEPLGWEVVEEHGGRTIRPAG